MYKLGLKLWSTNTDYYYDEAIRLYNKGIFDYIELYVVPDTTDTLKKWKNLKIPFAIHAPHFNHGVNLADVDKFEFNRKTFDTVCHWADELNAKYIIFHPGVLGNVEETIRQINLIKDDRMIVENKPPYQIPSMRICRGSKFEEMEHIITQTGIKTCLDIGHCITSANYYKQDIYEYLQKFQSLSPIYYHIADNFSDSSNDQHLSIGQGNYDFNKIFKIINLDNHILLETNKKSKENLNDFIEDVKKIKSFGG